MAIEIINGYHKEVPTVDELKQKKEENKKRKKLWKKTAEEFLIAQGINSPEEIKRKIIEAE